jgi:Flp pilus assembly protein TadD
MTDLLASAHRHRKDGQLQAAESLCRQVLESDPRNADAHDLLGQLTLQSGRTEEAAKHFGQAAEFDPRDARHHVNLGQARFQEGDLEGAETAFQEALALDPDHADALFGCGMCCEARGRSADAEAAYRRAAAARPDFPQAINNLAAVLTRTDRPAEAVEELDGLLARRPEFQEARFNRGAAYYALRRLTEAEADFRHILKRQPVHAGALNELGRVMLKRTRVREAAEFFREGHRQYPKDLRFLVNLAGALERLNDLPGAEAAIEKALALAPQAPALLYMRACLAHRLGRFAEARGHLDDMLSKELSQEHRSEALFELGEVLDKLGESGNAFQAIASGNALRAQSPAAQGADGARFLARVTQAHEGFTRERIRMVAARAPACERLPPVFFVGFPRSGTTLMERALKAHPRIVTTDERSPLAPILAELSENSTYPEDLEHLTDGQVKELQDRFWAGAETNLGPLEERLLVDKMPLNIVNLGLANCLFPDARVLVALRDPRDACLSCFMQRFQFSDAMVNFFELERTATTYVAVMKLWLHLRQALSLPWHEYRYEDLVEDFEGTLRDVLDFIGLPWHEDVMAYGKRAKDQVITTPSYRQVTRAIDTRAAGRWRRYQGELSPILPVLQPLVGAFGYPED